MIYPDCRKKLTKDAYPYGMQFRKKEDIPPDEISPYWDGHLDEADCFFDMRWRISSKTWIAMRWKMIG